MYRRIFAMFIGILAVAFLDAVFIGVLPFGLHRLHLLPLALIFILLLANIRLAAWWALVGGLILEVFSFQWFGFYLILLFIVLIITHLMFDKIITNRSIYSITLISAVVTLIWDLVFLLIAYQSDLFFFTWWGALRTLALSIAVNVIAAALVFYIINAVSHRFRPVFLMFNR